MYLILHSASVIYIQEHFKLSCMENHGQGEGVKNTDVKAHCRPIKQEYNFQVGPWHRYVCMQVYKFACVYVYVCAICI